MAHEPPQAFRPPAQITSMQVTLVAYTQVNYVDLIKQTPYRCGPEPQAPGGADELAEFAGRACYESWSRPNPETATNAGYLANILRQRHYSVLEHASATFYVTGVSRSLTHELIRHRHLSFSQLSQRFVKEDDARLIIPPLLRGDGENQVDDAQELGEVMEHALAAYNVLVRYLEENYDCTRKQAREAARAVLPNMTETRIVVTGNHRAWREFIAKRNSPAADAEIREFAQEVLAQLKRLAPNTYQDM